MTNGNEPAHPSAVCEYSGNSHLGETKVAKAGLTKREHFAAMAMQGLLANQMLADVDHSQLSIEALRSADALIEALNKTQY